MKKLFLTAFLSLTVGFAFASDDDSAPSTANQIYLGYKENTKGDLGGIPGIVKIMQHANDAEMNLIRLIIAQNEEIISLLKKERSHAAQPLAAQPLGVTTQTQTQIKSKAK